MAIYHPNEQPAPTYDAHTHLNDDKLYFDVPAYLGRAHEFQVLEMNVVGYNREGNRRALELAHQYEGIAAVIGFQPEDTPDFDDSARAELEEQLKDAAVVGVGETGLDYHWDTDPNVQMAAFEYQIELAKKYDLPVIIHNREAFDDVYQTLTKHDVKKAVIHSFSGTAEQAKAWAELGYYVSFSGVATFKKAKEVREGAKAVPLDQLLVETDAPWLAPTPFRGKTNEPGWTKYVVDSLAETLGMDRDELAKQTVKNAHRAFLGHD
ncbi:TatD family hydrolase [Fructobacillus sp. M1-13]|uniref:TatD family hydrolase n=1 Tax=Fructobacillus papyriferae TaxID=2713171 RepID=A0ABS5QR09_9LACO|nr:TatD family hydrolase [Fructobacillus papyriferae]MBS9334940.1 TatD family hydrolase [Fructobacillus papyriferae]MCD2159576.1 TatD family hydrolase [Fructobacillus papyriferae]